MLKKSQADGPSNHQFSSEVLRLASVFTDQATKAGYVVPSSLIHILAKTAIESLGVPPPATVQQVIIERAPIPQNESHTIKEFCKAEKISRAMFYKLAASGDAPKTYHLGRVRRISSASYAEWRSARL